MVAVSRLQADPWTLLVDLDGTLVCGGSVDVRALQALHRFVEKGGRFVPASGRPLDSILAVLVDAPRHACVIGLNGSVASVPTSPEVVPLGGIPVEAAAAVLHEVLSFEAAAVCVYASSGWWSCGSRELVRLEESRAGTLVLEHLDVLAAIERLGREGDPLKLLGIVREGTRADALRSVRMSLGNAVEVSTSYPEYLEITAPGVNKGTAVSALTTKFPEIFNRRIAAVGDGLNDLPMLHAAEISFAMQDAHEKLMLMADFQVGACGDGGVADAIAILESYE